MYIAKQNIGNYKAGEEVPKELAQVWEKMYKISPVEFVERTSKRTAIQVNASEEDDMSEDYLARSQAVVKKNIRTDKLSLEKLKKLLEIERKNKNRSAVIFAIKRKIEANKK